MKSKRILPLIVVAQFCCTSLWFAGNAVISDLAAIYKLNSGATGHLTSSVQFGFIVGTLIFAIFTIADRISPSRVFFFSALLGALLNLTLIFDMSHFAIPLALRFATGLFLAGIYPVGMKIASDYYKEGLGKSLGFLVGALVLGTAFPHLIKNFTGDLPWKVVIISTSVLASIGGLLIVLFVPDGPYRAKSKAPDFSAWITIFRVPAFRKAAFGYFGHMWELYTFWAFVPAILLSYNELHGISLNIPLWSFIIIGGGSLACAISGLLSAKYGTKALSTIFIASSGICCLLSPIMLIYATPILLIAFLVVWGLVVIADSPLFSTMVAHNAPAHQKATALTITNCIGFAITIVSIQTVNLLASYLPNQYLFLILSIGPIFGIYHLTRSK